MLFFQPSPPPPPPPVEGNVPLPPAPPPIATTHTLVTPAGAVQEKVPGVINACWGGGGGGGGAPKPMPAPTLMPVPNCIPYGKLIIFLNLYSI
jgi:hypothetical protein